MYRLILIALLFVAHSSVYANILNTPTDNEDYHSYDPFRDNFFKLREAPPTPLENNQPIPLIIHQFWIGPNPIPDIYQFAVNSCKQMKGFEHKLWQNQDIQSLLDTPQRKEIFGKIPAHDIAVQKDYLAYLALKKYGGIVLDASIMCRKNTELLHSKYSYIFFYPYDNITPEYYDKSHFALPIAITIIGSIPNSPLIDDMIEKFQYFVSNYKEYNQKYTSSKFDNKNAWHGWIGQLVINEAVNKYCFSKALCRDVHILTELEYFHNHQIDKKYFHNGHLHPSNILFIDLDLIESAYIIKAMLKNTNLDSYLNIAK